MRLLGCALAATGCNAVFGLEPTHLNDASTTLTLPPDASPGCPAAGTVPTFSHSITQAVPQWCFEYSISSVSGVALARCLDATTFVSHPAEGRIDDELSYTNTDDSVFSVTSIRIAPEGDVAYAAGPMGGGLYVIARYERGADGKWTRQGTETTPITSAFALMLSPPSRGPERRMLVTDGQSYTTHELRLGAGVWTEVGAYTAAELGGSYITSPYLSPDGLRMMYYASATAQATFYADRADITARFNPPVKLDVPPVTDPFLTEDCGRLYFSGLSSIFYSPMK